MKKIVILGASGKLGRSLVDVFRMNPDYEVIPFRRDDLDITVFWKLKERMFKLEPDIIINAAAITDRIFCENNLELAKKVNGLSVADLSEICLDLGSILVHYSASSVFDGNKIEGYKEDFLELSPFDKYGYSKALGESGIGKIISWSGKTFPFYLIRTAGVFGIGKNNLVDKFLNNLNSRDCYLPQEEYGSLTYAPDLAEETIEILEEGAPYGIYHLTNEGIASLSEVGKEILKIKDISGVRINMPRDKEKRLPQLLNTKWHKMRDWREALEDYLVLENK